MTTRRTFLKRSVSLLLLPGAGIVSGLPGGSASASGPSKAQASADGFFPHGPKMVFAGYSGNPARDLANGFTVAGPVYGDQTPFLETCFKNAWPTIAHIGPKITFNDKSPDKYKLDEPSLKQEIEKQVRELAPHREIVWWAVQPEELRHWRPQEMQYLQIVCDTIRKNDPLQRPIYHYNPNHRDAKSLAPIAQQADVLAKGCYTNRAGKKRDRVWIRWSVEQEVEALRTAGRPNAIALVMPEMIEDPEPDEDREIRAWARHDVYLGLVSGAKGVLIFSLFKRTGIKRSWQQWYDAYCGCGRELNGPGGLAPVFLFGRRESALKVLPVEGSSGSKLTLGGSMEPTTTSEAERAERTVDVPAWTAAEWKHEGSRWLFVVNSANTPASFLVDGLPQKGEVRNAFNGSPVKVKGRTLRLNLAAYEVAALTSPDLGLRASTSPHTSPPPPTSTSVSG